MNGKRLPRSWIGPWGGGLVLLLALAFSLLPRSAEAQPERPLAVGTEADFPPYVDVDAQGRATGFAVELFSAAASAMGMSATFHPASWDTVWQGLKRGDFDALPLVARLPEREGQVEFTRPHTIGYDSFFVRKDDAPIVSLERASTLNVIVLRSDAAHHALAGRGFNRQLVLVDDLADGLRLLASGQHDAVLAPFLQGNALAKTLGLAAVLKPGPLLREYRREFCFAVRKGDVELRDRLDEGLAMVKASGEYDRLYRKWLDIHAAPHFPVEYVAWGGAAVMVPLVLLALWTRQLRRQVALRTAELARVGAAVQAERQRWHDVLQKLPVYVLLLSADYRVTFANRFFEERYGKVAGRRCFEHLFNRGEPCEACETFRVLETHAPVHWVGSGPDGSDYEIHDYPFADADGSPMILEVGIDVTEMNRTRKALHTVNLSLERRVAKRTADLEVMREEAERARDLLQVTMDTAPALMSYIDTDGRYRRVNRSYETWFGHKQADVVGCHMREVLGEAAWQSVAPYVERAVAGEHLAFDMQVPYARGGTRWVHATYSPDRDAAGRVRGFVVYDLDITERKRAEEALHEADRRKDEFLAMLAHELRNPLAPIANAVHILKLADADAAQRAWGRDIIARQVEHLRRLVDELLDISRISRGKIALKKEPLAVADIVQRAVETTRPLLDARRHELSVQLPPQPVYVEGDPVRLEQVLSNLLNNAAKYTEEEGRIALTVEASPADVFLRVRDNGRGIDPSALPSLFDLFYQADRSLDRSEGGLGIGLSLVRSLVALHGGEVGAFSEGRGKGSEFTVRLPRLREQSDSAAEEPAEREPGRGGLRIEGHAVSLAYDGPMAVEIALAERPQAVLLDLGLPGMDGFAVARALRQQPGMQVVRLIALTGYGQEEDREKARLAGFDGYLTKPVAFDAIRSILATVR